MIDFTRCDGSVPFGGFSDPGLERIAALIEGGERLQSADGVRLFQTRDLAGLAWLADRVRERLHGNAAYYIINRHIDTTNLCANRCRFCSFSRSRGETGAWESSLEEIFDKAQRELPPGGVELHIVGGLHPEWPFDFYVDLLRGLSARLPGVHLKAFTAVEIVHMVSRGGLSVEQTLRRLMDAGLGSLPGGGAEIFAPRVRRLICPEKISGETWLDIHRTAHRLGLKTTCTMLYGHLESIEDRVDHLLRLRALQDETGGFLAFVPLAFHPAFSRLSDLPAPTGLTDLKVMAASRLLLDNIPHLKAYWISLGIHVAQLALQFGADDLDGTIVEESIYHMAGSTTPQGLAPSQLDRLIREAGRNPILRDAFYRPLTTAPLGVPA